MAPALARASFVRYGAVHKNLFVNSPSVLTEYQRLKAATNVLLAGQITGVEGYVESIASGLMAGLNAARIALAEQAVLPPADTMLGALMRYQTSADPDNFQPMNATHSRRPS